MSTVRPNRAQCFGGGLFVGLASTLMPIGECFRDQLELETYYGMHDIPGEMTNGFLTASDTITRAELKRAKANAHWTIPDSVLKAEAERKAALIAAGEDPPDDLDLLFLSDASLSDDDDSLSDDDSDGSSLRGSSNLSESSLFSELSSESDSISEEVDVPYKDPDEIDMGFGNKTKVMEGLFASSEDPEEVPRHVMEGKIINRIRRRRRHPEREEYINQRGEKQGPLPEEEIEGYELMNNPKRRPPPNRKPIAYVKELLVDEAGFEWEDEEYFDSPYLPSEFGSLLWWLLKWFLGLGSIFGCLWLVVKIIKIHNRLNAWGDRVLGRVRRW